MTVAEVNEHLYDAGYQRGYADGLRDGRAQKKSARLFDGIAGQVVVVGFDEGEPLTYAWRGAAPLCVGDRVEVPAPAWSGDQFWVGEVVELGSTYRGRLRDVLKKIGE